MPQNYSRRNSRSGDWRRPGARYKVRKAQELENLRTQEQAPPTLEITMGLYQACILQAE